MAIGGFDFAAIGEQIIQSFKGVAPAHKPLFFFESFLLLLSLGLFIPLQLYRKIVKKFVAGSDTDAPDFDPQAEAQTLTNVQIARLLGNERRSVEVALTELTAKGLCKVSDDKLQIVRPFIGDVFNLSPLAKAVLGQLPIKRGERLDILKKIQAFYDAIEAINSDLVRRKLIPARGFIIRAFQSLLRFLNFIICLFAIPVMVVSGILVLAEFEQVWPHAIILALVAVLLVKQTCMLLSETAADRQATRRGQVVTQWITSQGGLRKLSLSDYAGWVAVFGTVSLSNCTDPDLVRLHEWFVGKGFAAGDASGGCSVGGCGGGDSGGDGGGGGCSGCGGCGGCGCGG
jgi:uncharacterized protein (TIGR04222 family)